MLDATSFQSVATDAWRDDLSHGHIVLFRFPLSECGEDAEIKARPCLVFDIETIGGVRYAASSVRSGPSVLGASTFLAKMLGPI